MGYHSHFRSQTRYFGLDPFETLRVKYAKSRFGENSKHHGSSPNSQISNFCKQLPGERCLFLLSLTSQSRGRDGARSNWLYRRVCTDSLIDQTIKHHDRFTQPRSLGFWRAQISEALHHVKLDLAGGKFDVVNLAGKAQVI